jgi:recombination protein RecA
MSKDGLKDLLNTINKKHGEGAAKFGDDSSVGKVNILASTGSIKLDQALGIGGNPRGRMTEFFGPPSGGKTTLALIAAIACQKVGGIVAFIDIENTFTNEWFINLGGDPDKLIFCQPSTGNEALDIVETMVKSNEIDFIIVDSTTALTTAAELDSEMGDAMMGQLARLMSTACKKINSHLGNSKAHIAWISQTRQKIGSYGNPNESASGGSAVKFYSSIRYEVSRGDIIGSDKENPLGFITKIKIAKNKLGPPFRKVETELMIGPEQFGINVFGEIVDLAIINNLIMKSGAWFKVTVNGTEERFQGRENLIKFLKDNKVVYDELYENIRKTVLKRDAPVIGSFNSETQQTQQEPEKKTRRKKEKDESITSEEVTIPVKAEVTAEIKVEEESKIVSGSETV